MVERFLNDLHLAQVKNHEHKPITVTKPDGTSALISTNNGKRKNANKYYFHYKDARNNYRILINE